MRTIPAPLLAHMQGATTTLAWALKLTRRDAQVFGFTSADRDVTLSAVLYRSAPGLDVSSLVSSAGFAVDNAELTVLTDDALITRADILAGRWDGAAFELARYNWASPGDGVDVRKRGTLGNLQPRRGAYVAELRGLRQALQQTVGAVVQPTCRYRLGSTAMPDGLCLKALGPFTHAGTLTGVTSQRVMTDSARAEAAEYFDEGLITWTGGLNTGLTSKVASFAAGAFTLSLPLIHQVQVGDTYSAVAGCRKRLAEDCVAKFANGVNFGGEPHLPGQDALMAPATFGG